ncbi:MAG: hypothetical protein J6S71_00855 [Clostridia bacterium]|nr:hypothetical protein [Clostridia bacterium]
MKKYLPIILLLLIVLILPSCAGIGDGALIKVDPRDTQSRDESTVGAEESQLLSGDKVVLENFDNAYIGQPAENIPFQNSETKCIFSMCSFTGEERANLSFEGSEAYDLFKMVFYSRREQITESSDRNHNYIDIDFYYDTNGDITRQGRFRVYANDCVEVTDHGVSTMVSSRILSGYTEGIYQKMLSYASESIKPDRGVLITINPKPEGHDLSVEDAAEIYKLLMTAERQAHDEPVIPTTSMETIQVIFNTEYGRAAFYVNKDDAVGYYEGFLEGEHDIYFKIEGIHKKLMDYIK